jgi:hypothetical protein
MKRLTILRLLAIGVMLVAIAVSCSGKGTPTTPADQNNSKSTATLSLGDAIETGDEISVPVEYADASDLYSFSFRIGFDPAGLRPEEVMWDKSIGPDDSTFQMLDREGFVPMAIARLSGARGFDGSGTLCTMKFRVLDPNRARPWIIDDPNFLVGRDHTNRPCRMRVRGEAR